MRRAPFTEADLEIDGPPFRLRDIAAFTGLSRSTLEAEIARGFLPSFRILHRTGSPRLFHRADVRDWWSLKRFDIAC